MSRICPYASQERAEAVTLDRWRGMSVSCLSSSYMTAMCLSIHRHRYSVHHDLPHT